MGGSLTEAGAKLCLQERQEHPLPDLWSQGCRQLRGEAGEGLLLGWGGVY